MTLAYDKLTELLRAARTVVDCYYDEDGIGAHRKGYKDDPVITALVEAIEAIEK